MRKPRSEYPSEQADKFLIRLPDGMRDALKKAADEAGRSTNAEIVHRLQRTLDDDQASALWASAPEADRSLKRIGRAIWDAIDTYKGDGDLNITVKIEPPKKKGDDPESST